jgi:hypothetical protein
MRKLTDEEIALELEVRDLQVAYLEALALELEIELHRLYEPEVLAIFEAATLELRRRVALAVLERGDAAEAS